MLVILLLLSFVGASDDLESTVHNYWDALLAHDKASAMKYVHPEDLNNFIHRSEARFESWKLVEVEDRTETKAIVKIQLQRILPNGVVGPVRGRETWVKTEDGWKLRVKPAGEQYRELFGGKGPGHQPAQSAQMAKELEIKPEALNFYAAFPHQPRILHIRNGLEIPAELLEVQVDAERFHVLESPDTIEPHSSEIVKLQYTGQDEGENLKSEILLRLRQGGQVRKFTVSVVYNYTDEISRWLMQQRSKKP